MLRRRASRRGLIAAPIAGAGLTACLGRRPAAAPAAPTLSPPATPEPTPPPAPTPEPTPEATPTPEPRNPLTDAVVADPALVHRRIVAVKIDNAPDARPPVGLGLADMVYEELAEGGLTRFIAFYLQSEPDVIGPVRSARLTDIYLGQEWGFILAYAGAGRTTARLLSESLIPLDKAPELGERLEGTPYFRDPGRAVPHNLFVHIAGVRQDIAGNPSVEPEVEIKPFPFQPPPEEVGPIRTIALPYIPAAAVTWRYDDEASAWRRFMAGRPHVDAASSAQITAENVVIQYTKLFIANNVEPDPGGNPVLDADLRGENPLRVFHSGQVFEGTWFKEHDRAPTEYRAADGSPMPFRPGSVWIHIVPDDFRAAWGP